MTTGDGCNPHQGVMLARLESTLPHTKKCAPPLLPPCSSGTIKTLPKPGGNALSHSTSSALANAHCPTTTLLAGTIEGPRYPGGNALARRKPFQNISPMAFGSGLMQLDSVLSGHCMAGNALIGGRVTLRSGPWWRSARQAGAGSRSRREWGV